MELDTRISNLGLNKMRRTQYSHLSKLSAPSEADKDKETTANRQINNKNFASILKILFKYTSKILFHS